MRFTFLFLFVLLFTLKQKAQDKLFFIDGKTKKGMIVSNTKDHLYFKETDTSKTERIDKSSLILVEDYKGTRYLYGTTQNEPIKEKLPKPTTEAKYNILSMQPIGILAGRISFQYERFTKDLKFGIVIPFALTFNPFGTMYPASTDTGYVEPTGVSFITGIDLNYYLGKKEGFQFFIGPRVRYGTDMAAGDVEGYTVQTQLGWKMGSPRSRAVQHISFGFGFLRVISVASAQTVDPKQSYAWGSINYRIGFKW